MILLRARYKYNKELNFIWNKKRSLAEIQQGIEVLKIKLIEDETKQRLSHLQNIMNINRNQI